MTTQSSSRCNMTAYVEWYLSSLTQQQSSDVEQYNHLPLTLNQLRSDLLLVDRSQTEIWKIMNFDDEHDDFVKLYSGRRPELLNITRGQAMEVSTAWCRDEISSLKEQSSRCHGPPQSSYSLSGDDEEYYGDYLISVHDTMCANYCLASDFLRKEAMSTSQCSCIELSTKEDDISYTREGDFCLMNSGQLLCDEQSELFNVLCGKECELEDFMCLRREYNQIEVPLRGLGNECNGGTMTMACSMVWFLFALTAVLLLR